MRQMLLIVLLFSSAHPSADAMFQSIEDAAHWFTFYYKNPEPAKIPPAIKYMSDARLLDDNSAIPPIFGFLAGTFRNNPEKVSAWVEELSSLREPHLSVVLFGLWYADLPDSRKHVYAILDVHPQIKEQYEFFYTRSPTKVEDIPLEKGAWVLDALWGTFMATGEKAPVVRIMTTLPWIDVKGDANRLLVGGAARWSLTSNAAQHEKVLEICEDEVARQPDHIAEKLHEVIANAQQQLQSQNSEALPSR